MERAALGQPLAQEQEVSRAELPFEFMLNALRLPEGFALQSFNDRTGLPPSVLQEALAQGRARGWLEADLQQIRPTARGFDFLNDLQALFLNEP
jgi:oxygen-independent coproporphyrinogen-3 oxidase